MAWFGRLRLFPKMLILAAFPLVCELAFVVTLCLLLTWAENERQHLQASKTIHDRSTIFADRYVAVFKILIFQRATASDGSTSQAEAAIADLRAELEDLKHLVSQRKNAEESRLMADADRYATGGLDLIEDLRQEAQERGLRAVEHNPHVKEEFKEIINGLAQSMLGIAAEERKWQKSNPDYDAQARMAVVVCVCVGVVVNVFMAVALVVFLDREMVSRLRVMNENAPRLLKEQALLPVVAGGDEITDLDRVLHDMALALKESMRKERAVVENTLDVICQVDADLRFTRVNPAVLALWGYEPTQLVGTALLDLVESEDRARAQQVIKDACAGGGSCNFEVRLVRKDESLCDVLWSMHWVADEEALFCVAHDVSDRKELERQKQEFVAMVSHDLRTPLTSLLTFLEATAEGVYGEPTLQLKQKAVASEDSVRRLIDLINDLLDLEKLEAGKMPLYQDTVAVLAVCQRAADAVREFAQAHGVAIKVDTEPFAIWADGDRLVQVLVNLLSNSVKFSAGGTTITVRAKDEARTTLIEVIDQGRGIPPDKLGSIFSKFTQVKAADGKRGAGTGLGLSICKAIVEGHGGTIAVESDGVSGTTFWFRLPKPETEHELKAVPDQASRLA